MIKVLVTGAKGQLSTCMELLYDENKDVDYQFYAIEDLNITDREAIEAVFNKGQFDFCLNCAAYTNVDGAETEREKAMLINDTATANLASACKNFSVVLIHISTDYVFDGETHEPYSPSDETRPINIYGESKLAGEKRITETLDQFYIIRASWLYSDQGHNFVKTIARLVQQNKELKIVDNQYGSPTSCYELSRFIHWLILNKSIAFGIYHFSASNHTNWFNFAQRIASYFPNYTKNHLSPTSNYPTAAKRPSFSVMDLSKTRTIYDRIISWEEALDEVMIKLLKQ